MFNNPANPETGKEETFTWEWPTGGKMMMQHRNIYQNGQWVAPPDNQPQWELVWIDEHYVNDGLSE